MLGASGASAALKATASALASQALKKLPQKALTKSFYYPIVKSIARFFGKTMTKQVFAKGVAKTIPVIGGVASGGLTFATMRPMGMRLADSLNEAMFEYAEEDMEKDLEEIQEIIAAEMDAVEGGCSDRFVDNPALSVLDDIAKTKDLYDRGVITEEEFAEMKKRLISKL